MDCWLVPSEQKINIIERRQYKTQNSKTKYTVGSTISLLIFSTVINLSSLFFCLKYSFSASHFSNTLHCYMTGKPTCLARL